MAEAQTGGAGDGDVIMGPSGEGSQQNLRRRREDTWQDLVNNTIPHRDLRYNQANLPPVGLGNILDASMRMRPPAPPSESELDEDDDAPPLSRKEVWVKMEYHKGKEKQGNRAATEENPGDDANDGVGGGNSTSMYEVLDICNALREDVNSGFNKIIEKMEERRGPTTRTSAAPRKSRSGKKISTVAQRRDPLKNENAKIVREHLTALVGEDMLYTPMVTEEESALFETQSMDSGRREPSCTAEAFRFDILGTPRNPWNTLAARVFYHSLVPEGERSNAKLKLITEAFHTRIKSLKGEYKRRRNSTDHQARKRYDRRQARKHYLFQRRLEVALEIPQLNQHYPILEELTVAGMSSDESDSEQISLEPVCCRERPKYEVTAPAWRNPRLHNWLRVFDVLHTAKRRNKGPSAGEWPHNRFLHSVTPKPSSSSRFVPGLPIDAYNARWLGTRYDVEWTVQPLDQEYNFTHSDEVYAYLNQAHSTL